jgi:hypothetical protein
MSMVEIQKQLKAPKGQFNTFGKYYYRSCEDIVESVKPLLAAHGFHLVMTDQIVAFGDRVYVQATATVKHGEKVIESASACARESLDKKGMDDSQITGTASSYARKYALNGLFAIDDTKDADTDEHQAQKPVGSPEPKREKMQKPEDDKAWYNAFDEQRELMLGKIMSGERSAADIVANLRKTWKVSKETAAKIMALETGASK